MGNRSSKKHSELSTRPSTSLLSSLWSEKAGTPSTQRTNTNIRVKGCWIGNQQCPLLPEIAGITPFVVVRVTRKSGNSTGDHMLTLYVEGPHKRTTQMTVQLKIGDKLQDVPTTVLNTPKTPTNVMFHDDEGGTMEEVTKLQFQIGNMTDEILNYVVNISNLKPVEGAYTLHIHNSSQIYDSQVLIPRQFKREWWTSEALKIPTTVIGNWLGFTSYGGSPLSIDNCDWMHYNPSHVISVNQETKCIIALTKSMPSNQEIMTMDIEERDKTRGFGIGFVVLKLIHGEQRVLNSKDIANRIVAHSVFPSNPDNEMGKYLLLMSNNTND